MEIKFNDLYPGQPVTLGQLYCVISNVECATTTTGSQYYKVTLSRPEGTLSCTLWSNKFTPSTVKVLETIIERTNCKKALMQENTPEALEEVKKFAPIVVKVAGSISDYKGKLQMDLTAVEIATDKNPFDYLYSPISEETAQKLRRKLMQLINEIEDEDCKTIVHLVLNDPIVARDFFTFPAALTHHHAYRYGLLLHVVQVIVYALAQYDATKEYHKKMGISRDLTILLALLHDLGKIEEYHFFADNTIAYNDAGSEHQASTLAIVREILAEHGLRNKYKTLLGKFGKGVYEHHGVFGDEKAFLNTKCLETLLIHHADNWSAKLAPTMEEENFEELLEIFIQELLS